MKTVNRLLAGIMALSMILSFAGCNGELFKPQEITADRGGYSEELVTTLPNYMQNPSYYDRENEKNISFITDGMKYIVSEDGKITSEATKMFMIDGFEPFMVITGRDNMYFVYGTNKYTGEYKYAFIINDSLTYIDISDIEKKETETVLPNEEQNKKISIPYSNFPDKVISYAVISNDLKDLFFIYDDSLYIMDSNYKIKKISDTSEYVSGLYIIGDFLYVISPEGVEAYSVSEKKKTNYPEAMKSFFDGIDDLNCVYMTEENEGICYILCSDGIFRYKEKQNHVEQIIDGKKYKLGSKENRAVDFCVPENRKFLVLFENGEIRKYAFDCEKENEVTSSLKILSFTDDETYYQYVNDYSVENQNVQVDYDRSSMTAASENEIISLLKSSEAPDIILLDGADIDKLSENDVLLDMSECEESWSPDEPVLDNVVKWNSSDSGLYCVSTNFSVPAIGGKKEQIEKIKDFYSLSDEVRTDLENNSDRDCITGFVGISPFLGIVTDGKSIFQNEKSSGNNLENIKKYYEACLKTVRSENWDSEICGAFVSSCYDIQLFPKGKQNDFSPEHFLGVNYGNIRNVLNSDSFAFRFGQSYINSGSFTVGMINNIKDELFFVTSLDDTRDKSNDSNIARGTKLKETGITFRYGINPDKKIFVPKGNIGICKNGKNQKEALRFIRSVLENKNQKKINTGLPVNLDTMKWYFEKETSQSFIIETDGNKGEILSPLINPDQNQVNNFNRYIKSLDEPVYVDNNLFSIIQYELIEIIKKRKTVSEAAEETVKFFKDNKYMCE